MGAGRPGDDPSRRADVHRGRPVHLQLHLPGRLRASTSARRPTARAPAAHRNQRLRQRLAAARHSGRDRRRQPAGHDRLQLLADDAGRAARPTPTPAQYNDLALVTHRPGRRRPASIRRCPASAGRPASPAAPGGLGSTVYSYGNSSLRGGVTELSPKQGMVVQNRATAGATTSTRSPPASRATPAAGSSTAAAQAFGVLSTVQIAPLAGSNGVGDLPRELAYMRAHSRFTGTAAGARNRAVQRQHWSARSSAPGLGASSASRSVRSSGAVNISTPRRRRCRGHSSSGRSQ